MFSHDPYCEQTVRANAAEASAERWLDVLHGGRAKRLSFQAAGNVCAAMSSLSDATEWLGNAIAQLGPSAAATQLSALRAGLIAVQDELQLVIK